MKPKIDYTLYLVTDSTIMSADNLETVVEQAILGGCTLVQLREKDISSKDFYSLGLRVKAVTDKYNVPLIVNDRADVAMAIDAAGVHVGQSDLPCAVVRKIVGENKIVGVSASSLTEAKSAESQGADYIGVGAMFPTGTKTDASIVSIEELHRICGSISLPIVVIGGINKENAGIFRQIDIDGLAVVSAIISQPDIKLAAKQMKDCFMEAKN